MIFGNKSPYLFICLQIMFSTINKLIVPLSGTVSQTSHQVQLIFLESKPAIKIEIRVVLATHLYFCLQVFIQHS